MNIYNSCNNLNKDNNKFTEFKLICDPYPDCNTVLFNNKNKDLFTTNDNSIKLLDLIEKNPINILNSEKLDFIYYYKGSTKYFNEYLNERNNYMNIQKMALNNIENKPNLKETRYFNKRFSIDTNKKSSIGDSQSYKVINSNKIPFKYNNKSNTNSVNINSFNIKNNKKSSTDFTQNSESKNSLEVNSNNIKEIEYEYSSYEYISPSEYSIDENDSNYYKTKKHLEYFSNSKSNNKLYNIKMKLTKPKTYKYDSYEDDILLLIKRSKREKKLLSLKNKLELRKAKKYKKDCYNEDISVVDIATQSDCSLIDEINYIKYKNINKENLKIKTKKKFTVKSNLIDKIYVKNKNYCIWCLDLNHLLRNCPERYVINRYKFIYCKFCLKPNHKLNECVYYNEAKIELNNSNSKDNYNYNTYLKLNEFEIKNMFQNDEYALNNRNIPYYSNINLKENYSSSFYNSDDMKLDDEFSLKTKSSDTALIKYNCVKCLDIYNNINNNRYCKCIL